MSFKSRMAMLWKKYSFLLLFVFVIAGLFDLRIAIVAIICMVAPVIVSVFRGRFWCGNMCPRGSFFDHVIQKISGKRPVPRFMRTYVFRLLVLVLVMAMFISGIISNWGNLYAIGFVFYRMIVVTTILGIVLALFFSHRTWCSFCPMGTLASILSRLNPNRKLLKVASSCVSCSLCEKKCSMGIVPYSYKGDVLSHHDCIQCGQCVTACPKQSISYE